MPQNKKKIYSTNVTDKTLTEINNKKNHPPKKTRKKKWRKIRIGTL